MRITIIGSGAIACLFAARLAKVANVGMLAGWDAGLAALQRDGIWVSSATGNSNVRVPVNHKAHVFAGSDIAIVAVKAYQTQRAAQQAAQLLASDGIAVTFQNGLGNLAVLQATLGETRAAQAVTAQGATLLEPGSIRAVGGGATYFAASSEPNLQSKLASLSALLQQAGFETQSVSDLAQMQWQKLVANCAINPLTALLRVRNGELLQRPSVVPLMSAAAQEVATVATAMGIAMLPDPAHYAQQVAAQTAQNLSSMLQDVMRGSPTEIEVLNGAVVRAAAPLGIAVPTNDMLWRLVNALTSHVTAADNQ